MPFSHLGQYVLDGFPGDIGHYVLLGLSPFGEIDDPGYMCAHISVYSATAFITTREC